MTKSGARAEHMVFPFGGRCLGGWWAQHWGFPRCYNDKRRQTSLHLQRPFHRRRCGCCCCCERNHPMRHVSQSQCAKVGRGHGRYAGGCSDSATDYSSGLLSSVEFCSVVVPIIYTYMPRQSPTDGRTDGKTERHV